MHKVLKFAPPLVPLVLSGEKTSTWRLWDDKNLSEGDVINFLNKETLKQFATAKVTKVVERELGSLSDADWDGHERFSSDQEMFETYSRYYDREVSTETPVKILWFKITS